MAGIRLRIDAAGGGIPASRILASAPPHGCQAAIPPAGTGAERVGCRCGLMDADCGSTETGFHDCLPGHVPVIGGSPRNGADPSGAPRGRRRRAGKPAASTPAASAAGSGPAWSA